MKPLETLFSAPTATWFAETFTEPTEVQRSGWPRIAAGCHCLLVAPTGSGKTLAAFLWAIDSLRRGKVVGESGVRILYVSPLKALVHDVERNLRAPLVGIERAAERLGMDAGGIRVHVRTGDTPPDVRRKQAKKPAEILVTTPESLFLLLGSKAVEGLRTVQTVIIDEVHAIAASKRGLHLALSLERLCERTILEPQRVGLSATVKPVSTVASFLGGARAVEIVDSSSRPMLDVKVSVPVRDMDSVNVVANPPSNGGSSLGGLYSRDVGTPKVDRGIWAAIYPSLLDTILANRTTIIFVNSRGQCERLAGKLNEMAGEELVLSHHGSVSHEKRAEIEERLKRGEVKGIVATSSLELGIDMGAVDQVVLVESPGAVARGLQRVGRAGHQVGAISRGTIYPKYKGDLLECAVIARRMLEGDIESLSLPHNALDVLAQQIVAMCCDGPRGVEELFTIVTRTFPYQNLSKDALVSVLEMLSGHYPSEDFADLRPRLSWDRGQDELSARRGSAMVSRLNAGTIPDRGLFGVHLGPDGPRVGELDEEMVFESKTGDNIILGASTWRIEQITRDRVFVSPAPGEPGRMPFWHGDGPGRPIEIGRAVGALTRKIDARGKAKATAWLVDDYPLDELAAHNLVEYVHEQRQHTGAVPTDLTIVVERFRDELGDWRVCILSPFGSRVHAPWAMALQRLLEARSEFGVQVMYTDDGIVLRLADVEELPALDLLFPQPEEVETLVTEQLAHSALFTGLFRENAARSLLITRRNPQARSPLWAQRRKAESLLATVKKYPSFPVVMETYRQALGDVFDLPALRGLLGLIQTREVQVHEVETASASPFARSLVFAYVAAYIYEQDTPIAERKAQALTLDRNLLKELLGETELRDLIDADALTTLERELQHLVAERAARDSDELHDLLRKLGDLNVAEIDARSIQSSEGWLVTLEQQRRAIQVAIDGEWRWVAAQDAGLYRDALGCMPPDGLPESYLAPDEKALHSLLTRFARVNGPFTTRSVAQRYAIRAGLVESTLEQLERAGTVVRGEISPYGSGLEWCDKEVLQALKRRTLAKLRNEIEPVEHRILGLFLPQWQGVQERRTVDLIDVIGQLQGLALPWSALSEHVLPSRVSGFTHEMLDLLAASGQIVWVGNGAQGTKDGRVALYLRQDYAALVEPGRSHFEAEAAHTAILKHLEYRGASFSLELQDALLEVDPRVTPREFESYLWDLVWAGLITNDTLAPLRALGRKGPARGVRGGRRVVVSGRWSLLEPLFDEDLSPTERAIARAQMLLRRYGLVTREAVEAEKDLGGFTPIYRALVAMEERGQLRRGYFVEGLSGAQFASAGAVERLRAARDDQVSTQPNAKDIVWLPAVDPANPYGALIGWPLTGAEGCVRPRRVTGAWVGLLDGKPAVYISANRRQLLTFPDQFAESRLVLEAAFRALSRLPKGRSRALVVEKIDGQSAKQCEHAALLESVGFVRDYRGLSSVAGP